jgi:hypothetical protein
MVRQEYCLFSLFSFKSQNSGVVRVELHRPPLKMKELWESKVVRLDQKFNRSSLEPICLVLLHDGSVDVVQCVGEISNVC